MPEYLPRIVDDELTLRLEAFGATLIVGPKWCGKTTTGEQKAKSILREFMVYSFSPKIVFHISSQIIIHST